MLNRCLHVSFFIIRAIARRRFRCEHPACIRACQHQRPVARIGRQRRRAFEITARFIAYGLELQLHGADMAHDCANEYADDSIGDDLLRLVFIACHPVLPLESRVALTLRLLGGLSTAEIARAFLQPEPTVAQRIVRAKRTLTDKQVPFEVPRELAWRFRSAAKSSARG